MCATCHTLYTHPLDEDGNEIGEFPEQVPYLEWLHSEYASDGTDPRSCQDCHMVDIETFRRAADEFTGADRPSYHQYFNGANFVQYFLGKVKAEKEGDTELAKIFQHKYDMAVQRLQAAARLGVTGDQLLALIERRLASAGDRQG